MSALIELLQEADAASVRMEQARQSADAAKSAYEEAKAMADEAKTNLDAVVARADEIGVPRAKFRKLVEERSAVLMASGLIGNSTPSLRIAKPARKRVKADKEEMAVDESVDIPAEQMM